jgi:hypothetical protein
MKKWTTVLLTALMVLALPLVAGAEKEKFKSDDYNFSRVKNVTISSISMGTSNYANLRTESPSTMENMVNDTLRDALESRHLNVGSTRALNPDLKINVVINSLGSYIEHKAAYDTEETVDKKEVGKDENGNDIVVTVPTKETVHHPAEDITHAVAVLRLTATDVRTGKEVYSVTDNRERSSESDPSGMLHRICKDFAKDISKN